MKKARMKWIVAILIVLVVSLLLGLCFAYPHFVPYGRHKVENTEILRAYKIIEKPDSVAVIRFGIAIEVSEEKRDQIYDAFARAFEEQQPDTNSYFNVIGKEKIESCLLHHLNIEFRYKQRRQMTGIGEYDAVLFSFEGSSKLIPVFYKDGQYIDHRTERHFNFDEAYFADFKKTIKGII